MKTRNLTLVAGQDKQDTEGGTTLVVEFVSALGTLKLTWLDMEGNRAGTITNVQAGKKYSPGFEFSGYSLRSGVDADIRLLVGYGDADVGQVVNVTIAEATIINDGSDPVPVEGSVELILADTITDNAAVAVTDALTAVLAAGAARRSVRLLNQGANDVAIGGAGLTWAKRTIVLEPGDMWVEDCAPGAVIKAICNTALTATLGVQVIT